MVENKTVKNKFDRKIEFTKAFDKRNNDPHKNYGICSVYLKFILSGKEGAIQFVVATGWHLKHVVEENNKKPCRVHNWGKSCLSNPMPFDLGYHSYIPRYDGHRITTKKCVYLNNKPCYYDGSSFIAKPILEILISQGDKALWKELERQYHLMLIDV